MLLAQVGAAESNLTAPPPNLPVTVLTKCYLTKLFAINAAHETFDAEFYLTLHWKDPRLVFDGGTQGNSQLYLEEAVKDKLKTIWWPQLEYTNAQTMHINNQILEIYPDGSVDYHMSVLGTFSSPMNFSDFPFDTQILKITIDSFVWDKNALVFEQMPGQKVFNFLEEKVHNDLEIKSISVRTDKLIPGVSSRVSDSIDEYSSYIVSIEVKRRFHFLVYQIFIPLFIVLGMSYSLFFGFSEPFLDRVMICLSCLLVFLASKFTLNLDLPKIGYMTIVDKAFLIAYIFIALTLVETVLQRMLRYKSDELGKKLDVRARWAMPLIIVILAYLIFRLAE
ncbi:MAG: hypothetical protein JSS60_01340 [Verrucomicrobia bacterium]|nr:hypothetical protein [Verrucomicrobiota bacterium]